MKITGLTSMLIGAAVIGIGTGLLNLPWWLSLAGAAVWGFLTYPGN